MSRALLAAGLLLLVLSTAQAVVPDIEHGRWESTATNHAKYAQFVQGGIGNTIPVEVVVQPSLGEDGATVIALADRVRIAVPSLADERDHYGIQVRTQQRDATIEPLVLWAEPQRGGERLDVSQDRGAELVWETVLIQQPGQHRLVTSSDSGSGPITTELMLTVSPAQAVADPVMAAEAVRTLAAVALLGSLGISIVLYRQGQRIVWARRRAPAARDAADDSVPIPKPVPTNLPRGDSGFGRMEPRLDGVRDWAENEDGLPERLAQMEGRGWVIRID